MTARIPLILLLALTSADTLPPSFVVQHAPPGVGEGGVVVGVVVQGLTEQPVPGAVITMSTTGRRHASAVADESGRFTLEELPPGRLTLVA